MSLAAAAPGASVHALMPLGAAILGILLAVIVGGVWAKYRSRRATWRRREIVRQQRQVIRRIEARYAAAMDAALLHALRRSQANARVRGRQRTRRP